MATVETSDSFPRLRHASAPNRWTRFNFCCETFSKLFVKTNPITWRLYRGDVKKFDDCKITGIKMPIPLNVRRQLSTTIKRFRFEELESAVIPSFPETSWSRVRSRLVKHHENFTVANAHRIIEQTINEAKISDKELKDRLATLELIEVSRHHKKKIWYSFAMKESDRDIADFLPSREIKARIVQNFRIHQMEMDVRITTHEGITFISMRDKPRGKEPKRMTPIFFALFVGQQYLFCSKKSVTKECVQVLVESLGYSGAKKLKLIGRDLKSLIKMLWIKKQGAVQSSEIIEPPDLAKAEAVIKSTGINFRQNKQRREYVERCFGDEPPTLETLVVTGAEETWLDEDIGAKLPDEKVYIGWEFRTHNVAATLTKLAECRVFTMPLPPYVANWMKTGKNELKIQQE